MPDQLSKTALAQMIDHTLLKPEATRAQIEKLCLEAIEFNMYAVCVNPYWLPFSLSILTGQDVKICTVIGFPLGCNATRTKVQETAAAIKDGAAEIDMVMNIGLLKSGDLHKVEEDIRAVVNASERAIVKVILETCLLTESEKISACRIAQAAGANYVKTSTGFNRLGATLEDVTILRNTVAKTMGVKASGGIRDISMALAMIGVGASRLGTSSSVSILSAFNKQ